MNQKINCAFVWHTFKLHSFYGFVFFIVLVDIKEHKHFVQRANESSYLHWIPQIVHDLLIIMTCFNWTDQKWGAIKRNKIVRIIKHSDLLSKKNKIVVVIWKREHHQLNLNFVLWKSIWKCHQNQYTWVTSHFYGHWSSFK